MLATTRFVFTTRTSSYGLLNNELARYNTIRWYYCELMSRTNFTNKITCNIQSINRRLAFRLRSKTHIHVLCFFLQS